MSRRCEKRAALLGAARRIVIKVGSRLLCDVGSSEAERIRELVRQIAWLREQKVEVFLVSSGAIGAGLGVLDLERRPTDLARLQALAAVGQSRLMALYEQACAELGFHCGQVLLCTADVQSRRRHLNICNCLHMLQARGVLPVINENDTVSVDEIRFGDNDTLAAKVATMLRADLTILLTTVDGLCERTHGELGARISCVDAVTPEIRALAGGTDGNSFSVGGMETKLQAADICTAAGEHLWIADGHHFSVLRDIWQGADVGTLFTPRPGRMTGSKRYLAFFSEPAGDVVVDSGAEEALRDQGSSLLPSGVLTTNGQFEKGDTVRILNETGGLIGHGMTNYGAIDLHKLCGLRSHQFEAALAAAPRYDEAIHRDNLVISRLEAATR